MTKLNATPGPWKIRDWHNEPGDGVVMDRDVCAADDKLIATAYEKPADAHLITAAPELYGHLRDAQYWMMQAHNEYTKGKCDGTCSYHEIDRKITALLARARGEQP